MGCWRLQGTCFEIGSVQIVNLDLMRYMIVLRSALIVYTLLCSVFIFNNPGHLPCGQHLPQITTRSFTLGFESSDPSSLCFVQGGNVSLFINISSSLTPSVADSSKMDARAFMMLQTTMYQRSFFLPFREKKRNQLVMLYPRTWSRAMT